jgi:hypothetical protein
MICVLMDYEVELKVPLDKRERMKIIREKPARKAQTS